MSISLPQHLYNEIAAGQVILVLGAGASVTSRTQAGTSIKAGDTLAREIAGAAGLEHSDEGLAEVIEACHPIVGDAKIKSILERNYLHCRPSKELEALFAYTWRRIYTFNVDDTIRNISRRSRVQQLKYYNALKDRREDAKGLSECQVIHLHGYVNDYYAGFVFSASEYARRASQKIAWYEKLGEDFHDYTVLFVGTKLDEPLLFQHIQAVLNVHETSGQSYLFIPTSLSSIRVKSLENRSIVHVQGSISDLTASLSQEYPGGNLSRCCGDSCVAWGGPRCRFFL